ncbi:hypothetical protein D3C86_1348050 [compost metagenome]
MRRARSGAVRPAELTTVRASRVVAPSAASTSSRMPSAVTAPVRTGDCTASIAPAFSASPSSAVIRPWLSMMPVEGESSAAWHSSCGSSARAASRLSSAMSCTPLASALARMPSSVATCAALVATISLPQRWCGTWWEAQKSYNIALPRTHSSALSEPFG